VDFLVKDERERVLLTCLVACLFAREVYKPEVIASVLGCLGHEELAGTFDAAAENARRARWRLKIATGYDPRATRIPKRFTEVTTWKGPVDAVYMEALRAAYAEAVAELGAPLATAQAQPPAS